MPKVKRKPRKNTIKVRVRKTAPKKVKVKVKRKQTPKFPKKQKGTKYA